MAVLLVIGLVHAFGLWWGDILVTYAVCGFFLLLFRNLSQRAILRWAHAMYWFVIVLFLGFYIATLFGVPPPAPPDHKLQETIDIYARGTFAQIFALRAREWWSVNSFVFFLTRILGIFLFGLYLWRQGYLRQPADAPGLVEARAAHRPAPRPRRQPARRRGRLGIPSQSDAADAADGRDCSRCSRSRCRH